MRSLEILKESMTMWVPDAPREKVSSKCPFCDGTGIDSYVNKKNQKSYFVNPTNVDDRLQSWDQKLKKLDDARAGLVGRLHVLRTMKDANTRTDLINALSSKIDDLHVELDSLDALIKRRLKRLSTQSREIQKLEKWPCGYCNGEGTYEEDKSEAPEVQMSNANAMAVMRALGYTNDDWGYTIEYKDIPGVKRRILELLNTEQLGQYTRPSRDTHKDQIAQAHVIKDPSSGLDTIKVGKKGPRVIDPGIDTTYLKSRLNEIMGVLDYAQKHKYDVTVA